MFRNSPGIRRRESPAIPTSKSRLKLGVLRHDNIAVLAMFIYSTLFAHKCANKSKDFAPASIVVGQNFAPPPTWQLRLENISAKSPIILPRCCSSKSIQVISFPPCASLIASYPLYITQNIHRYNPFAFSTTNDVSPLRSEKRPFRRTHVPVVNMPGVSLSVRGNTTASIESE